jgi:ATP-dependent Clp protease adapter protein ClpS
MSDTLLENGTDTTVILGKPHKVILYNDDHHDQLEVTLQIMKAINCNPQKAASIMLEANDTGSAIVFTGSLERCELVESILAEIRLGTKIEPA